MNWITELVLGWIWWLLLFPVALLVCTPVILIAPLFQRRPYGRAVSEMYGAVVEFWREWGLFIVP